MCIRDRYVHPDAAAAVRFYHPKLDEHAEADMANHAGMQAHLWLAQGRSSMFGMVMRRTPPEECRDAWSTTLTQGEDLWALMRAGGT
eukprot:9220212-Prorocentrum_lima.AAC.1